MSRSLDDLSEKIRPKVDCFLARLTEIGIPVKIIDTLRTKKEQVENVKKKVSWTMNSKHLPDKDGKANAIDICPLNFYALKGPGSAQESLCWDADNWVWDVIGKAGEACGLTWGGRWKVRDLGHFEI